MLGWREKDGPHNLSGMSVDEFGTALANGLRARRGRPAVPPSFFQQWDRFRVTSLRRYTLTLLFAPKIVHEEIFDESLFDLTQPILTKLPENIRIDVEQARNTVLNRPKPQHNVPPP